MHAESEGTGARAAADGKEPGSEPVPDARNRPSLTLGGGIPIIWVGISP